MIMGLSMEYIFIDMMRHFEKAQSKVMRVYAQSGQYRTFVEAHDS